jgi:pimeloyl-ACP methyl ester carboxylesterase
MNPYFTALSSATQWLALLSGLFFCGVSTAEPLQLANPEARCIKLANAPLITAKFNARTDALPEHCQVDGKINPRTGIDGKPYAINFRLRLPTQWNGRFYMSGGGGINGVLIDPIAQLKLGFATIGTDSGHDNSTHNDPRAGGTASFGVDPQARVDFAFNAYDQVTRTGKALTGAFYKTAAKYSYFEGCSEGGREALLMAQRFPEHYDGIVAGAPTLHLPLGPMAGIHTTQLFAGLASRAGQKLPNGQPAIGQSMSDADLGLVRQSILSACDALDGAADGIVANLAACTTARVRPSLLAKQCMGAKTATCLSADQIQTLEKAYAGATDSKGRQLYSDWAWDPGVNSAAWRSWWLGADSQTANNAIKLNFVSAIAVLYSSEPKLPFTAADTLPFSLAYNFDTEVEKIYNASPNYAQSAAQMYFTDSSDLSALQRKGGKLMVYHGGADSAISALDTLRWFDSVNQKMGIGTPNFARMFIVPGMNHCRGGPATDKFDMLKPVMDWVERGIDPDRVVAEASAPAFFNTTARSRPLCPHPQISQYKGSGDINDERSFSCQAPFPARSRELLVDGNVTIDVIVDGAGPAVVLLPSSLRDSEDFDDVASLIAAKGFKVLRPQPRGMGRSSAPPVGMTLHTLAKDVALTIERLSGGQAVVVGHAYGHWTARVMAMNHPHLVRGVVVAGASAKVFPVGTAEALAIGSDPTKPDADRISALQKVMFAKGNDPKMWLTGWHPQLRAAYRAAGAVPAKEVWFNQASSPILDLQGDQDPWRPAATRNELKDVIGDKVTVQVISNASHALLPEQPQAVADAITAWIKTLK